MRLALPPVGSSTEQRRHRGGGPGVLRVRWKEGCMDMRLNQMHYHHVERISRLCVAKRWSIATILVVGLAGLIHLRLVREHFAEQFVYGLVFTALALFQLTLALFLAVRPGPPVFRVVIFGSLLISLVYVVTRLIPLPGASVPEEADALGIAATGLELAAVLLLAVARPEPATTRTRRGAPLWWVVARAMVLVRLCLILPSAP